MRGEGEGINKFSQYCYKKPNLLQNKKHSSKHEVKQQAPKHEQELLYNATLTHHIMIHTSSKDICIALVILSIFFLFIKVVKMTILYIHSLCYSVICDIIDYKFFL